MPEGLKGRVVLTVRHLHPEAWYTMELLRPTNDIAMNTHVYNITNNTMESLSQWLYFTPDPGSEINTRQRGPDKGSISVVTCFLPPEPANAYVSTGDDDYTEEKLKQIRMLNAPWNNYYRNDIMICVLKEPVFYHGKRLDGAMIDTKNPGSLNENGKFFSIGYGRPDVSFIPANSSDRVKYLAGWNTKKATHSFNLHRNNDPDDPTANSIFRFPSLLDEPGRIDVKNFVGPSDSGSPVINSTDNLMCVCGILEGWSLINLAPNIGWIVTAVEYYGNMIAKKE
jgi:hypothetical protein